MTDDEPVVDGSAALDVLRDALRRWAGTPVLVEVCGLASVSAIPAEIASIRGPLMLVSGEPETPDDAVVFAVGGPATIALTDEIASLEWMDVHGSDERILRVTQNGVQIMIGPDPHR